jgi:hypothetical protein
MFLPCHFGITRGRELSVGDVVAITPCPSNGLAIVDVRSSSRVSSLEEKSPLVSICTI